MEVTKGQIVDGIVTGIKPYGAFIEIENGPVALAYIEDLSVVRIKSPAERVQVGQKIKCMVKCINEENGRNLYHSLCINLGVMPYYSCKFRFFQIRIFNI